jgi:hypothetical protein
MEIVNMQPPQQMASTLASLLGQSFAQLDPLVASFFAYFDTQAGMQVGRLQIIQVRQSPAPTLLHAGKCSSPVRIKGTIYFVNG